MRKIFFGTAMTAVLALGVACQSQTNTDTKDSAMDMMTDTMITKESANSVELTIDRLEAAAKKKGLIVFARVNHQDNAAKMDLAMPPSTLLIFGSPKIGSPLMNAAPTIGIDLPVKVLAYEGKEGKIYVTYNNPAYLKKRHNVEGADGPLGKMTKALDGLTNHAISK